MTHKYTHTGERPYTPLMTTLCDWDRSW